MVDWFPSTPALLSDSGKPSKWDSLEVMWRCFVDGSFLLSAILWHGMKFTSMLPEGTDRSQNLADRRGIREFRAAQPEFPHHP